MQAMGRPLLPSGHPVRGRVKVTMSLRVRIRWLLVVSAACCVVLATVALYWVNLSLVDTLTERNAERELEKVEAAFLPVCSTCFCNIPCSSLSSSEPGLTSSKSAIR